ncbi:MAG: hypothetical protein KJ952_01910 [Candidatus Omnitrophica bacterium]|nr:hypothetical protein [Candidatus Omnitrophota bacterium]
MSTSVFASMELDIDFDKPAELKRYKFEYSRDNNNDGEPDGIYYKHNSSNKECLVEDKDYDGKFETITYYEEGELSRTEMDIDKDGKMEYRYWYKDGKVDRLEETLELEEEEEE